MTVPSRVASSFLYWLPLVSSFALATALSAGPAQLGPPPKPPAFNTPAGADASRRAAAALEIIDSAVSDPSFVSTTVHPWLFDQLTALRRAIDAVNAKVNANPALDVDMRTFDTAIDHAASAAEAISGRETEPEAMRARLREFAASLRAVSTLSPSPGPFVAPTTGTLYLRCVGGSAGATSIVGLGTTPKAFRPALSGLPGGCPSREVAVGSVKQGELVPLGIETHWNGLTYWAFAGADDHASHVSFTDTTNLLGMNGQVAKQTAPNIWVLHLNDAAHYTVSDAEDDNLLIQIRIAPALRAPVIPTGPFQLVAHQSLKCVDATPGRPSPIPLTQEECSDRASQRWRLQTVKGGYEIVSAGDPHACLHLRNATMAEGARVFFSACSAEGQPGEVWSLQNLPNGTTEFVAAHSAKCLNVSQQSAAEGAAILQWTCKASPNEGFMMTVDSAVRR